MRAGVDIFALDYDAIIAAMYALTVSAEGDCYLCVPPDPGIEPAALGTSESALSGMVPPVLAPSSAVPAVCESALSGTAPTETALSGTAPAEACHTFTLDSVLAQSTTVLPCPAVPSGSLSGFHLPSFSTNLVSNAVIQDQWVDTFTPGGQRVAICTCSRTGRHLATFTRRPGSSLYTLTTASPQVAAVGQVSASGLVAHASRVRGQGGERYFLLVVDDYSRYTTVFPLRTKGEVPAVLIPWIRTVRLQLRRRFRTDLPVLRLHSDRGGEFSSDLLRTFCQAEGIEQTFTLPDSPQQNGIAERRIGLVMEVARTSLVHAAAPHFLWPFAVRYAAHQLNLWPRVSLPETSPTLRWTGEVGDASRFRVDIAEVKNRVDKLKTKLSQRYIEPGAKFGCGSKSRLLKFLEAHAEDRNMNVTGLNADGERVIEAFELHEEQLDPDDEDEGGSDLTACYDLGRRFAEALHQEPLNEDGGPPPLCRCAVFCFFQLPLSLG
ncbi:unnamed protein product [Closterium sp. Yama58-4]|nr:unnamed protein product [Closterium sp. Yama58-4]